MSLVWKQSQSQELRKRLEIATNILSCKLKIIVAACIYPSFELLTKRSLADRATKIGRAVPGVNLAFIMAFQDSRLHGKQDLFVPNQPSQLVPYQLSLLVTHWHQECSGKR